MSRILKYVIVLLLADITMVNLRVTAKKSFVSLSFEAYQVVPDVVPKAPKEQAIVLYPSGVAANEGNLLPLTLLKDQPSVSWSGDSCQFYTLAMVDPDVPSRIQPTEGEFRHWLVVNVPGVIIANGDILSTYFPPTTPPTTGPHRYVILIYKQPGKLDFEEFKVTNRLNETRKMFSIDKFAKKYNLHNPIAGNFFQAEFGDNMESACMKQG